MAKSAGRSVHFLIFLATETTMHAPCQDLLGRL
jgi:hypothetical protein